MRQGQVQSPQEAILLDVTAHLRPYSERYENRAYQAAKRVTDIVIASLALILLFPIFVIITAVVAKGDGFPILFRQKRIGQGGRTFYMYKFRSMRCDAEQRLQELLARDPEKRKEFEETYKLKDDPRIIPGGSFLRSSSLDELPQLINVILGDMTLVGPRPIVEKEIEKFGAEAGTYLAMKPGCAGLWQCSGRNDTSYEERLVLNRRYFDNASWTFDVWIMWETFRSIVQRKGAY